MLCISVLHSKAQNWQTVPANDTVHYVVNDTLSLLSGQLRVIWIDSSSANGNNTKHYFYPSLRPTSSNSMCLDTIGATWMGKHYIREQQGDEYYFNLNGDTISIKTMAGFNETWTLFKNAGDTIFQAQIIAMDTTLVDGVLDSMKRISIQAYYNGLPIADIHNNQIILSKEHGFLRSLEWCYFGIYQSSYPYPKMEKAHNRLPAEITSRNLNADISKFQVGNEWIMEMHNDVYDIHGTDFVSNILKIVVHDSIVSIIPVANGINAEIFKRQRIISVQNWDPLIVTDDTASFWVTFNIDTTLPDYRYSLKQVLPEYNLFELQSLIQFQNQSNLFTKIDYTVNFGCNGKLILNGSYTSTPPWLTASSFGDTCFILQLLGNDIPVPLVKIYEESSGLYYSRDAGPAYLQVFNQTNYSNINGCTSGAKYNILLPADVFQLQTAIRRENHIHLEWITRNEKNVSRFEIQRKIQNANFETVGEIKSLGDNTLTNEYMYHDPLSIEMKGKELQYRIRMIDHDGKAIYSNVIHLNTEVSNDIRVYPIPFKDYIQLDGLSKDMEYKIEITDLAGRVLHVLNATPNLNGIILIQDLRALAYGMYILNLKNDESVLLSTKISK